MDRATQNAWVERVFGITVPQTAAAAAAATSSSGGVEFAKLRLSWDDARKHLAQQLRMLRTAIVEQSAEEDDLAEIERHAGDVEQSLVNLDDGLSDALDDLYNAGGGDARLRQTARALASSYRGYIDTDPLLQELDNNPFVPLTAKQRLDGALNAIVARL